MDSQRVFDVVMAGLGLCLMAIPMGFIALIVRITSGTPVLFRHRRIGRNGVPFEVLKYRTMLPSADGPAITVGGDPRVTSVGRVLRRTKLDELPQLLNVLRGEMSIVGPRPEIERYVLEYPEEFARILRVRPGITDPASVMFRDEEAVLASSDDPEAEYRRVILPAKLVLASVYVANRSVWEDMRIVARTIRAVMR